MMFSIAACVLHHAILSGVSPLRSTGFRAKAKKKPASVVSTSCKSSRSSTGHSPHPVQFPSSSSESSTTALGDQHDVSPVWRSPLLHAVPASDDLEHCQPVPTLPLFDQGDKVMKLMKVTKFMEKHKRHYSTILVRRKIQMPMNAVMSMPHEQIFHYFPILRLMAMTSLFCTLRHQHRTKCQYMS